MKKYTHILFDLDGTLADSKLGITKAIQYGLEKLNIIETDISDLEKFIGPPLRDTLKQEYSIDHETATQIVDYARVYLKKGGNLESEIFQEIPNLLMNLKEKGYKLAVATSKPTELAKEILTHYDLSEHFEVIMGSNMDNTRANKDEIIHAVLEELNLEKNKDIIMVGDKEHDVIGARKNNISSVGVLYGYGTMKELSSSNPDYMVNSLQELESLFIA